MSRKKSWVKVMAYNLFRKLISKRCLIYSDGQLRKKSFKITIDILINATNLPIKKGLKLGLKLLSLINLYSKYRWAPRAIKKKEQI